MFLHHIFVVLDSILVIMLNGIAEQEWIIGSEIVFKYIFCFLYPFIDISLEMLFLIGEAAES